MGMDLVLASSTTGMAVQELYLTDNQHLKRLIAKLEAHSK